jgi:5-methylcytosine-specific restriction endonuclease McrA|tara:strand:- start:192 stop:569 length:378 start_codon:yes stop_codon:yes gene_type:complete
MNHFSRIQRRERKNLEDSLDRAFSRAVRERAGGLCERCGKPSRALEAHHVVKRRILATRWDLGNGVALCPPCHWWAENYPEDAREWAHTHLGTRHYEDLLRRSRARVRRDNADLLELRRQLREAA